MRLRRVLGWTGAGRVLGPAWPAMIPPSAMRIFLSAQPHCRSLGEAESAGGGGLPMLRSPRSPIASPVLTDDGSAQVRHHRARHCADGADVEVGDKGD